MAGGGTGADAADERGGGKRFSHMLHEAAPASFSNVHSEHVILFTPAWFTRQAVTEPSASASLAPALDTTALAAAMSASETLDENEAAEARASVATSGSGWPPPKRPLGSAAGGNALDVSSKAATGSTDARPMNDRSASTSACNIKIVLPCSAATGELSTRAAPKAGMPGFCPTPLKSGGAASCARDCIAGHTHAKYEP